MTGSEKVAKDIKATFNKTHAGVGFMINPIKKGNIDKDEDYLLVHTNIQIPAYWNLSFYWDAGKVQKQLAELMPDECVAMTTMVRPFWNFFWGDWETITVWKSREALKNFYLKGNHARVLMRWRNYVKYGENAVTFRYKISGEELAHVDGYDGTKEFFLKIKSEVLPLWE
eukprot:NODE_634_length_5185_cov_0.548565.p4 type:complete len:170 gc:universal NODE_634_length_5185_cov_0.548565:1644-1135(-)